MGGRDGVLRPGATARALIVIDNQTNSISVPCIGPMKVFHSGLCSDPKPRLSSGISIVLGSPVVQDFPNWSRVRGFNFLISLYGTRNQFLVGAPVKPSGSVTQCSSPQPFGSRPAREWNPVAGLNVYVCSCSTFIWSLVTVNALD